MSENVLAKILRTHPIESITQRRNGIICIHFKRPKHRRANRYAPKPKPHDFSKAQTKLGETQFIMSDVESK
jgi:hypothetical protein